MRASFALGFPVRSVRDTSYLDDVRKPRLFVQGENDVFGDGAAIRALVEPLHRPRRRWWWCPAATTIFTGHLEPMQQALSAWMDGRPWALSAAAAELLDPRRTALVVVDLQEKLLPAIDDGERVLRQHAAAAPRLARVLELPVARSPPSTGAAWATRSRRCARSAGEASIDKTSFGCFGDAGFRARLARPRTRPACWWPASRATSASRRPCWALSRTDYCVHVAADAVGSRTAENRSIGLARMERAGAVVSSARRWRSTSCWAAATAPPSRPCCPISRADVPYDQIRYDTPSRCRDMMTAEEMSFPPTRLNP